MTGLKNFTSVETEANLCLQTLATQNTILKNRYQNVFYVLVEPKPAKSSGKNSSDSTAADSITNTKYRVSIKIKAFKFWLINAQEPTIVSKNNFDE